MKVIKRLETGESKAEPVIHFGIELDPQIKLQPKQLKTIADTITTYGNTPRVSRISILGEDCGHFSLRFKSYDELYDYVNKHDLWDAESIVLRHEYFLDTCNFAFRLWDNKMNVSFRCHGEEEVLQLIEHIEAALLAG